MCQVYNPVIILKLSFSGHSPPDEGSPHFSDYSLYPDKFDPAQRLLKNQIDQHQSLPTPSGLISKYNFRIRRSSESDDTGDHSG